MDVGSLCAVFYSSVDIDGDVVFCQFALGDPLEPAAVLLAIGVYEAYDVFVDAEDHCVNSSFFAESPCLEDFFVGEVVLQKWRDVDEVAAVCEATGQVAAAD